MGKKRGVDARWSSEFAETQYNDKGSTIPVAIAPTGPNYPTARISAAENHSATITLAARLDVH